MNLLNTPNPAGAPGIVLRREVNANNVATGTTRISALTPLPNTRVEIQAMMKVNVTSPITMSAFAWPTGLVRHTYRYDDQDSVDSDHLSTSHRQRFEGYAIGGIVRLASIQGSIETSGTSRQQAFHSLAHQTYTAIPYVALIPIGTVALPSAVSAKKTSCAKYLYQYA